MGPPDSGAEQNAAVGRRPLFLATLKVIPLGVAYAVWGGLGILLISAIGVFVFKQALDWPAYMGIALIGRRACNESVFKSCGPLKFGLLNEARRIFTRGLHRQIVEYGKSQPAPIFVLDRKSAPV